MNPLQSFTLGALFNGKLEVIEVGGLRYLRLGKGIDVIEVGDVDALLMNGVQESNHFGLKLDDVAIYDNGPEMEFLGFNKSVDVCLGEPRDLDSADHVIYKGVILK